MSHAHVVSSVVLGPMKLLRMVEQADQERTASPARQTIKLIHTKYDTPQEDVTHLLQEEGGSHRSISNFHAATAAWSRVENTHMHSHVHTHSHNHSHIHRRTNWACTYARYMSHRQAPARWKFFTICRNAASWSIGRDSRADSTPTAQHFASPTSLTINLASGTTSACKLPLVCCISAGRYNCSSNEAVLCSCKNLSLLAPASQFELSDEVSPCPQACMPRLHAPLHM